MKFFYLLTLATINSFCFAFSPYASSIVRSTVSRSAISNRVSNLQMNFFEDALKYFSNLNKEASAKHILIKGPNAAAKCEELKTLLSGVENVSEAFSELAMKESQCPSGKRGGNLGTFKPGMMVKEFDQVCFEKEVGIVHGPVTTQFGSHLILITRRYEGENEKK